MRLVPLLDASGAQALAEFVEQAHIMGAKLVLSGVQQQPLSMLERIHLGSGSDRISYAASFAAAQSFVADLLETVGPQATRAGRQQNGRTSGRENVCKDI